MTIEIDYSKKFLKDLKKLRKTDVAVYKKIRSVCFEELPSYENISDTPNLKKLRYYDDYYRIRIGNYRVGLKRIPFESNVETKKRKKQEKIQLLRVLHRKDVYKYFP